MVFGTFLEIADFFPLLLEATLACFEGTDFEGFVVAFGAAFAGTFVEAFVEDFPETLARALGGTLPPAFPVLEALDGEVGDEAFLVVPFLAVVVG